MRNVLAVWTAALIGVGVVLSGSAHAQRDSLRTGKRASVSFRLARSVPTGNYERVTVSPDRTVYVAPGRSLSAGDVVSSDVIALQSGSDVILALTEQAARRFGAALDAQGADRLAVFVGGKVFAAGELSFDHTEGTLTLSGLSSPQAERLVRIIKGQASNPTDASVTLIPDRTVIQPGEEVTVGAFISAKNLRAYQLTLEAIGGTTGQLAVQTLWIDASRNSVFGDLQKLEGVDEVGMRIGVVAMQGGVDADRSYAGSFTLRASDDASGTFNVRVRLADNASLLTTPDVQLIRFSTPSTAITVGASPRTRTNRK
jgi:hypothetical protein